MVDFLTKENEIQQKAFLNILICHSCTDLCLYYRLDTMVTTPVWQSAIAHTSPPTSKQTNIFRAALHHRSHCLFILHFGYFVAIFLYFSGNETDQKTTYHVNNAKQ